MVNSIYYSNSKINPNYLNPNKNGYRNLSTPSFKSQPEADTVTLSTDNENQKKKLSKGAKWGIGLGSIALAGIGICFAVKGKPQSSKISKIFWDNVKEVRLEKNLKFSEFKDKDAALKFAKENLKLKNIDENISLEALNDVIESFIYISNKNNGKIYIPNKINYDISEGCIASMDTAYVSDSFGTLTINKNLYNENWLNEFLEKQFYKDGKPLLKWDSDGSLKTNFMLDNLFAVLDENLLKEYYKDPGKLTIKQKQSLVLSKNLLEHEVLIVKKAPLNLLKKIKEERSEFLNLNNLNFNIDEISQKTLKEQQEFTKDLLRELLSKKCPYSINIPNQSMTKTFYHEYGHLYEKMANKDKFSSSQYTIEHTQTRPILEKLLEKGTIKKMPDFFNKNEQEIAAKVSIYSLEGIGEFIAETYAKLIQCHKLDDDVIALYKKYGGPEVF